MTSISIHIIANQSSYHDYKSTLQCFTCLFCPQLIRNVRSRRRIDSSCIIAHPVNSDLHTWEKSLTGRGRHWNFDPPQCLGPWPEILDRYISLSCLGWLLTAFHERLVYFHWPQWVTWLVTWWVTWSRSPDAGRHIGKFSLWTTLLRFSRSAQIFLFSNFTKLGQLFFDNIFFGLAS